MENASVSPAQSAQWSTEEFVIRSLNSSDIQSLQALHVSDGVCTSQFHLTHDPSILQAELMPSAPTLRPVSFYQFLTHPTHLCLVATLPSSNKPIACIAASIRVATSDLAPHGAPPPPIEVHVFSLGVLPAFRRRGLATRLLKTITVNLRALAATAPQVSRAYSTASSGTRVYSDVSRADSTARAFWKHVGLLEQESTAPHQCQESWAKGWRDVVSVAGPIASAA